MADIYEQHKAAFAHVSAYVILKDGDRVATIAFKFPRDGAGRLWAYVHWIGTEMVRGYAGGYGYDKRSAAAASAARKAISDHKDDARQEETATLFDRREFFCALREDGGHSWDRELEGCGFTVLQAV